MTKCPECGLPMQATREDYPYEPTPGLVVTLHDLEVLRDESGHVAPSFPHLLPLHRAIAVAIVRKPARLAGPEIRFLRAFLGMQATELAPILGVSRHMLSRWENGMKPIGAPADRLLRVVAVMEKVRGEFDLGHLAAIGRAGVPRPLSLAFRFEGKEWRPIASSSRPGRIA